MPNVCSCECTALDESSTSTSPHSRFGRESGENVRTEEGSWDVQTSGHGMAIARQLPWLPVQPAQGQESQNSIVSEGWALRPPLDGGGIGS